MTQNDLIDLATTIPLWIVVAIRVLARPKNAGQRAILNTFAALAVGALLRLSLLNDLLVRLTGINDFAVLPKHLMVMLACTLLVGWVESVVPPRDPEPAWRRWTTLKPRMTLFALTGAGAIATFPLAQPSINAPDGSHDFASAQFGDLAGSLHLSFYLLPMGIALSTAALLCLIAAARTDDMLLRACMRLMAAGAAAGAAYPVYRTTFLLCGLLGWDYPLSEGQFNLGGSLIQMVTILLVIAGSSVRAVDLILRTVRYRRLIVALRPLWQELVSVLPPDTILRHFKAGTSPTSDRRQLRDLYGRLDERVVEISDATFELLPWIAHDLPARALAAARAAGLHGADARAAREAICLRVARLRAVDGEPYAPRPAITLLSLQHDLTANAAWLARVAEHYTSPRLTHAVNTLAHLSTPQEVAA
ncbi:MAB_1171c family putative transporter [Streptomyces sp. NPDC088732]|uniref:MAB_1171c family putative transporter n=1 Tax=Streptomyces sp. NPDC088732 TaxID=3365879 RepID=UPI0037F14E34